MKTRRFRSATGGLVGCLLATSCSATVGLDPQDPGDQNSSGQAAAVSWQVVDTGQDRCYDDRGPIDCPGPGEAFHGQDAQYDRHPPSYSDNGDGTVTDRVTGLMWSQSPDIDGDGDIDAADKLSYGEALFAAAGLTLAGHTDWRLPTIKELFSLIDFSGVDPSGYEGIDTAGLVPFIDTDYYDFGYGDVRAGERIIDAQFATSTRYVGTTMGGAATMFGVNFADGRIKGYPTGPMPGQSVGYMHGAWIDVHGAGAQRSDPKSGDPNAWLYGHGPQGDAIRIQNHVRLVRGAAS